MNKFVKITALFSSFLISNLFYYKVAYFIGEKYFFDKLFYQKSEAHGYTKYMGDLTKYPPTRTIGNRIKDVRDLISLASRKENQVLGIQNDKVYKIAVIGDSIIYGEGVKKNERLSEILEKRLNKIYPTNVFTLGLPGEDILDNYAKFLLAKQYLDVDLYIIGMVNNDLVIGSHDKYPNEQQLYENLKKVCPQKEFVYKYTNPTISPEEDITEAWYPSFQENYANLCFLEEIVKKITKNNVMFYNFFPLSEIDESAKDHIKKLAYITDKYVSIINKHGGYIVDSLNIKNFVKEDVSKKEGHPSKKTHQFYAKSLFKEITENPRWKFPVKANE